MSIIVDENGDEYEWSPCPICRGIGEVREYYPSYDEEEDDQ